MLTLCLPEVPSRYGMFPQKHYEITRRTSSAAGVWMPRQDGGNATARTLMKARRKCIRSCWIGAA
jgi:hypothetical protein